MREPAPDPYRVLGVSREATAADITRAYRRRARPCTPTRHRRGPRPQRGSAPFPRPTRYSATPPAAPDMTAPGTARRHRGAAVRRRTGLDPGPAAGMPPAWPPVQPGPAAVRTPALWAGPVRVEPLPGAASGSGRGAGRQAGWHPAGALVPAGRPVVSQGWADLDQGLFSISVAAELAGLHPQTLRLYEREGLLDPARSPGGTRRYSRNDITRLHEISELAERRAQHGRHPPGPRPPGRKPAATGRDNAAEAPAPTRRLSQGRSRRWPRPDGGTRQASAFRPPSAAAGTAWTPGSRACAAPCTALTIR